MTRKFEDSVAKRGAAPLLVGLMGPTGSGKTYSALRLASGVRVVTGGEIFVIDTESRRSEHYADRFRFRHVPFVAPFGPLDYLAAIEHCVSRGAKVVVVDSMSHEHEGPGGVLEQHDVEQRALAERARYPDESMGAAMQRMSYPAWAKPKQDRRRLLNTILQLGINAIFCFRAKEKIKLVKGAKEPKQLGWMPIAGEEFLYEMTLNALLPPNSRGVARWQAAPDAEGEGMLIKCPEQFLQLFARPAPFTEATGEALARWAAGGAAVVEAPTGAEFQAVVEGIALTVTVEEAQELAGRQRDRAWNEKQRADIKKALKDRVQALKKKS